MINNFNEFIPLALRSESKVENIAYNKQFLLNLFNLQIAVGEMLDCVKKDVFYGKDKKMNEKFSEHLLEASVICNKLQSQYMNKQDGLLNKENLEDINPRFFHGVVGIATEASELSQILVKHINNPTAPIDTVNVSEELADAAWYTAQIVDTFGLNFYRGLTNVIDKLHVRYPEKFSSDLAENRNLEAERKKLEQVGF